MRTGFHESRQLSELSARQRESVRREEFVFRLHQSLDLHETLYTIANEVRQVIDCDRASVLDCRGAR